MQYLKFDIHNESSFARGFEVINASDIEMAGEEMTSRPYTSVILRNNHRYVPKVDGKFYPSVVYCDEQSCERHNNAHVVFANEPQEEDGLEPLNPYVRELHKRMLQLQDSMNVFFSA